MSNWQELTIKLDIKGNMEVWVDGDPRKGVDLKKNPVTFDNVDAIDAIHIISKANHSPCCVVWGGVAYCWC